MFNRIKLFGSISIAMLIIFVMAGCDFFDNLFDNTVDVTGVSLNYTSISLEVDDTQTLNAIITPSDATNQSVTWTSSAPAIATVSSGGLVTAVASGTATITVITEDGNYTAKCTVTVTSTKWVEINGIKWAKCNVDMPGTFAPNPEDAGMIYQWNRKVGWSAADPMINSDGGTIWDPSDAEGDTWEKANDPCPLGWRVPTHEELESLANADSQWTTLNGKYGRKFDSTDESLFLPTTHVREFADGSFSWYPTVLSGIYWSSSVKAACVSAMSFSNFDIYVGGVCFSRAYGFSVRCVTE
jgi:uncharacterized protein (TIGR02145 family)